jgi:membrane associated rhomboid family serine protease
MPPRYQPEPQYRISFGGPLTPAIKYLIIINVAIYVLELILLQAGNGATGAWFLETFSLSPRMVFGNFAVWQLVTYMFLHHPASPFHLIFNMLGLWMFGSDLEQMWGSARFVRFYLVCGIGAALVNCVFAFMVPSTLGASGAIYGLVVAYAMMYPHRTILLMMVIPVPARVFALIFVGISLLSVGALSVDGVAHFAHLGGALTGYLMMLGSWNPRRWYDEMRWRIRRRRFKSLDRNDSRWQDRDRNFPFH